MTTTTPSRGAAPGLPKYDNTGAEARLRDFCAWFDLEMPPVRRQRGDILMTRELLEFADREGLSLDWFITGCAKPMAAAARRAWRQDATLRRLVAAFDKTEQGFLLEALQEQQAGHTTIDAALEAWRQRVEEHRAAQAASPAQAE